MYSSRRPSSYSASNLADVGRDMPLSSPPDDSISDLSWSSSADLLAVGAWDNKLRVYNTSSNSSGVGKAVVEFKGPVLSCDWSGDGQKVVSAGADKTAQLLDLNANGAAAHQVAAHDSAIKCVRFFSGPGSVPMLATGSWDKTIKYWDLRSPTPVGTLTLPDKVYSMDVRGKLLVAATANQQFQVVDLDNPLNVCKTESMETLPNQIRTVKCFPDATGYAAGTIDGKCGVQWIHNPSNPKNFSFKCHRNPDPTNKNIDCYSVNALAFHPVHGTFISGGADGSMHTWDKDTKHRIKAFPPAGGPISAAAFNRNGKTLAYAVSYDWIKGYAYNSPQHVNKIMLHTVTDEEVKPQKR